MNAIELLDGPSNVARLLGIKVPSVIGWKGRVPKERCPALERASGGRITCEVMRPDVRWTRVRDRRWPHPEGRPVIDPEAPVARSRRTPAKEAA